MVESNFDFQNISPQPPLALVQLCGAIGTATVSKFQQEMTELQNQGYTHIILDMAGIDYISSVGMGTLVNFTDALDNQQGGLALIRVQPKISDLLEMLSLREYVHVFDTQEEAMIYFQSKTSFVSSEEVLEGQPISENESTYNTAKLAMQSEPEFYTFEQARKELQMDEDRLRRLIDEGELAVYSENRQMRFKSKDIINYKRLIEGEKSIIIPSKEEPFVVEENDSQKISSQENIMEQELENQQEDYSNQNTAQEENIGDMQDISNIQLNVPTFPGFSIPTSQPSQTPPSKFSTDDINTAKIDKKRFAAFENVLSQDIAPSLEDEKNILSRAQTELVPNVPLNISSSIKSPAFNDTPSFETLGNINQPKPATHKINLETQPSTTPSNLRKINVEAITSNTPASLHKINVSSPSSTPSSLPKINVNVPSASTPLSISKAIVSPTKTPASLVKTSSNDIGTAAIPKIYPEKESNKSDTSRILVSKLTGYNQNFAITSPSGMSMITPGDINIISPNIPGLSNTNSSSIPSEVSQTQGPSVASTNFAYRKISLRLYEALKKNPHFSDLIEKFEKQVPDIVEENKQEKAETINIPSDEIAKLSKETNVNAPDDSQNLKLPEKQNESSFSTELLFWWEKLCRPPLGIPILIILAILSIAFFIDIISSGWKEETPTTIIKPTPVLIERIQEVVIPQTYQESILLTPALQEYFLSEIGQVIPNIQANTWVKEGDIVAYLVGPAELCQDIIKDKQEQQKLQVNHSEIIIAQSELDTTELRKKAKEILLKIRDLKNKIKQKETKLVKKPIKSIGNYILKEWTKNIEEPLVHIDKPIFIFQEFPDVVKFTIPTSTKYQKNDSIVLQITKKLENEKIDQDVLKWTTIVKDINIDNIEKSTTLTLQLPKAEIQKLSLTQNYNAIFTFLKNESHLAIHREALQIKDNKNFLTIYRNENWQQHSITLKKITEYMDTKGLEEDLILIETNSVKKGDWALVEAKTASQNENK